MMVKYNKLEFQLVVFDHHTDMQKPMIEHMTSCGDWAEKVLETNPWLQQLVLIGPQAKDIEQLYWENDGLMNRKEISEKLLTFSAEEIHTREDKNKISKIKKNPACRILRLRRVASATLFLSVAVRSCPEGFFML